MVARVTTVAFQGVDVLSVDVQVQMTGGLPAFTLVGLPDKAVSESRERVRSALHALGLSLPSKRIIVNLAPADQQKEGSHYDLPIALGILATMGVMPVDELEQYVVIGELALDGRIGRVSGSLAAALHAVQREKGIICPKACGSEAVWGGDMEVLAPGSLLELLNHFKGTQVLSRPESKMQSLQLYQQLDLSEIKGQAHAKRVLEITAAGGHNLLMVGPPGSGKSMLAKTLPTILPPLSALEALEVTMVHSLAGQLQEGELMRERPYRDPHHSASMPAMIGGGMKALPGEVSLAHRGVLFLDELPEFARGTLECLRQPLETGAVTIARANGHYTYPARFQLVAAMNPCHCGYLDDPDRACSKVPRCGQDYQAKISGPLLDRIDLVVEVNAVSPMVLASIPEGESSQEVAARVEKTRRLQENRFQTLQPDTSIFMNAQADGKLLDAIAPLCEESTRLLTQAAEKFRFSARSYRRVMRVSRTIADMEESSHIAPHHLAEALSYRRVLA